MSEKVSIKTLKKRLASPDRNPFGDSNEIKTRSKKQVFANTRTPLMNTQTGEVNFFTSIHKIEEKDDEQFVKVFAAGMSASYELTLTAQKVFAAILDQYLRTPMQAGYADSLELYWYGDGIEGRDVGMSERTFQRGLRELIENEFLWPRKGSSYWVNPALFFKGDRVLFIREYRRIRNTREPLTIDMEKTPIEDKTR